VTNETVESFDKGKQDDVKGAVGELLGMDPEDLQVVLLPEPEIGGEDVVVEIGGFPTDSVTLGDVYERILLRIRSRT